MTEFVVEDNVPVPTPRTTNKYPFRDMEIGQSFLVPFLEDSEPTLISNRICTAARAAGKAQSRKFTTRKTNQGIRVWRAA